MSQTRQRPIKRQQPVKLRERREVVEAVVGVAAVVVGTILAVWLMRPGGLADRQPRVFWFAILGIAMVGGWIWWAYHPATQFHVPSKRKIFYFVTILLMGCVALIGWFWPGGLLRNTPDTGVITDIPAITEDTSGDPTDDTTATTGTPTTGPSESSSTTGAGNESTTTTAAATSTTTG